MSLVLVFATAAAAREWLETAGFVYSPADDRWFHPHDDRNASIRDGEAGFLVRTFAELDPAAEPHQQTPSAKPIKLPQPIRAAATAELDKRGKRRDPLHDALLAELARKHLRIETLETRNSDSLDFHSVGVRSVEAALEAAYQAGLAAGAKRGQ